MTPLLLKNLILHKNADDSPEVSTEKNIFTSTFTGNVTKRK